MVSQRVSLFVLAYDVNCGPCSKFRVLVGFLDVRKRIRFVSLESADQSGLLADVGTSLRYSSFHLMEVTARSRGRLWSGSEAFAPLVVLLSPWGAARHLFKSIPAASAAFAFVYSSLSRLHRTCPVKEAAGADNRGQQVC